MVDTAWTGTEVRRDRQTDKARERDVKKYWRFAIQRAWVFVLSAKYVSMFGRTASPSRLRCFEGGGHLRELCRLSWLRGEGVIVIVAQTWPAWKITRGRNNS